MAFFPIELLNPLVIHPPSFPAQSHVNPGAPIAPISLNQFSHPRAEFLIVWASAAVPQRVPI